MEDLKQAEKLFKDSFDNNRSLAEVALLRANIHSRLEEDAAALAAAEEFEQRSIGSKGDPFLFANIALIRAAANYRFGRHDRSLEQLDVAEKALRGVIPDHPDLWYVYLLRARSLIELNRQSEALAALGRSAKIADIAHGVLASSGLRSRLIFSGQTSLIGALRAHAFARMSKFREGLSALEEHRARELRAALARQALREDSVQANSPGVRELLALLNEVAEKISLIEGSYSMPQKMLGLREAQLRIIEELDELDQELKKSLSPGIAPSPVFLPPAVPPGTLILSFSRFESTWTVFGLDQGGVRGKIINIDPVAQKSFMTGFLKVRDSFERKRALVRESEMREIGTFLHENLIQPVLPWMEGKKRILVVPTGVLWDVPLEMAYDAKRARYLVEEEFAIGYLPAVWVFHALESSAAKRKRGGSRPSQFVAFAPAAPTTEERGNPSKLEGSRLVVKPLKGLLPDREIGFLTSSGSEAIALSNLYKDHGWHSAAWLGPEATVGRFLAEAPKSTRLFLSTHGIADPMQPLSSSLVFRGTDGQLGFLGLADIIFRANLRGVEEASLSACQIARGPDLAGEGQLSLSYGFMLAGVSRVTAPMWSVEVEAAGYVFSEYHRRMLDGLDPLEAMHQAKKSLLRGGRYVEEGREDLAQNPLIWAPFIVWGF